MTEENVIIIGVILYVVGLAVLIIKRLRGRVRGSPCPGCGAALDPNWSECFFCQWKPQGVVEFQTGPLSGQSYPVIHPMTTLGSVAGNTIVLSDPAVSQRHAQLLRKGTRWLLEDLSSRNGTYINGVRRERASLRSGDIIRVGHSDFVFVVQGHVPESQPKGEAGGTKILES